MPLSYLVAQANIIGLNWLARFARVRIPISVAKRSRRHRGAASQAPRMSLATGQALGPCRILASLGAGGMGGSIAF